MRFSGQQVAMAQEFVTSEARRELVRYLTNRTRDHGLAEDLAHDAILRLVRYRVTQTARDPRALLFRIADNLLISNWNRVRARATEELSETLPDDTPDPERRSIAQERLDDVTRVLADMPAKRREVLVRRRLDGESHAQIAEAMGLSLAAVEKHMTRALLDLRLATRDAQDLAS